MGSALGNNKHKIKYLKMQLGIMLYIYRDSSLLLTYRSTIKDSKYFTLTFKIEN